jgi:hypothetical protein
MFCVEMKIYVALGADLSPEAVPLPEINAAFLALL